MLILWTMPRFAVNSPINIVSRTVVTRGMNSLKWRERMTQLGLYECRSSFSAWVSLEPLQIIKSNFIFRFQIITSFPFGFYVRFRLTQRFPLNASSPSLDCRGWICYWSKGTITDTVSFPMQCGPRTLTGRIGVVTH